MHLNGFLIGNLAGFIYLKLKHKRANYDIGLIVLTIAMFLTFYLSIQFGLKLDFHNGLMAIFFVPFIILLALNTGIITRIASNKVCVMLGEISYGMYILQVPLILMINHLYKIIHLEQPEACFYISTAILIGVAAASYYIIEIPARNRIKSWYKKP
ncbi:acyltransferase family protein [Mucilaginibacter sp. HMF5004]|nr:acyltransferase family protein [Mucilaginibacter rivuli]MBW4888782.1 acyltransferase family protein [Mucilaginibacter rivuli]